MTQRPSKTAKVSSILLEMCSFNVKASSTKLTAVSQYPALPKKAFCVDTSQGQNIQPIAGRYPLTAFTCLRISYHLQRGWFDEGPQRG